MHLVYILAHGMTHLQKSATLLSVVNRDKIKVDGGAGKAMTQAASAQALVKKIPHYSTIIVCVCVKQREAE